MSRAVAAAALLGLLAGCALEGQAQPCVESIECFDGEICVEGVCSAYSGQRPVGARDQRDISLPVDNDLGFRLPDLSNPLNNITPPPSLWDRDGGFPFEFGFPPIIFPPVGDMGTSDLEDMQRQPRIFVDPRQVTITAAVGSARGASVRAVNIGNAPLVLESAQVRLSPRADMQVNFLGPVILRAGESQRISLVFRPERGGTYEGALTVRSDDPTTPRVEVSLRGEALCPSLQPDLPGCGDMGN